MSLTLPPLVNRWAALGLLGGPLLLVWLFVVGPLFAWHADLSEEVMAKREVLGRYLAVVAENGPPAKVDPLGVGSRDEMSDLFLMGTTDGMRAAALQTKLGEMARESGIRLDSARSVTGREGDGARMVGTEMRFETDVAGLQRLLLKIEDARPLLFARSLHVAVRYASDPTADNRIDVRLEVQAALRRRGGAE